MKRVLPISDAVARDMRTASWRDDPRCPRFEDLRLLALPYFDFGGDQQTGELVVAREVADELVDVFLELHAMKFPIRRMDRVDAFGADDDASMEADNTSAFNFRTIPGTDLLSHHALGVAVDINPRENPMIVGGVVHPASASSYVDRSRVRPGMIVDDGPVVALFRSRGWDWGGSWPDLPDYHHFSKRPRGA